MNSCEISLVHGKWKENNLPPQINENALFKILIMMTDI